MTLAVGCRARLEGLQSDAGSALNGATGIVTGYIEDKERWTVLLDGSDQPKMFKVSNLTPLEEADDEWKSSSNFAAPQELLAETARVAQAQLAAQTAAVAQEGGTAPSGPAQGYLQANSVAEDVFEAALHERQPRPRANSVPCSRGRFANATSSRAGVGDNGAQQRADPNVAQLRKMLAEWQSANLQWQEAHAEISHRYRLLEHENRQLREVLEVGETGPNMNMRFIARLARQNWRLGNEAYSDEPDNGQDPPPEKNEQGDAPTPEDTGRDRRPEGINRLPLRRTDDAVDGDVADGTVGAAAQGASADEQTSDNSGDEDDLNEKADMPDLDLLEKEDSAVEAPRQPESWETNGKQRWQPPSPTANSDGSDGLDKLRWKQLMEERRAKRASGQPAGQDVNTKSSAWSTVSRLAVSFVGLAAMATFVVGRIPGLGLNGAEAGDFEL